jgi:hypothetical protein
MVAFTDKDHKYYSIEGPAIDWISITTLVHAFCPVFDAPVQAAKSSKNTKSKWYGMTPEAIIAAWDAERDRSTELGTWYHNKREAELLTPESRAMNNIHAPNIQDGVKYALPQGLEEGTYPEFLCYLASAGICGQSDLVKVTGDVVNIKDYKTSKEIRSKGYGNSYTGTQMMLSPLSHLDDCEISHYSLQLSLYMYIILRHNPNLKPGKLIIEHVSFEEEGQNQYGYPIHKVVNGEPVVKEVKEIELQYKKNECMTIMNWLKNNKQKLIKHA